MPKERKTPRQLSPASSADDYVAAPHGRWFAGRTWLAFCVREPSLSGLVLWGGTDERDAHQLVRVLAIQHSPLGQPARRYIDLRRTDGTHASAFAVVVNHWAAHASDLQRAVTQVAVVHGGGLDGAMAAGMRQVMPISFPVQLFTDPLVAWRWLDLPPGASLLGELDRLQADVASQQLVIGPEARWFRLPPGPTISLGRMRTVRSMLLALARAHLDAPGHALSVGELFEKGWSRQSLASDIGAQRVYVALSTLRNLGLRGILEHRNDGYLLRPDICVTFDTGSPPA